MPDGWALAALAYLLDGVLAVAAIAGYRSAARRGRRRPAVQPGQQPAPEEPRSYFAGYDARGGTDGRR